jgi:hypothetical protein
MIRCNEASLARTLLLGWLLAMPLGLLNAQSLRDPTLPPAAAGLAATGPGASNEQAAMGVIVRDGRPYLVADTRLYAQGEKLGKARIERISETEVWLREGGVLRKVPQFAGIQRHTVTTPAPK